ncbi:MAG TPA: FkbM family methyltransferase [Opitutaceae bacterium]|nr:FkbM family methyltransferase [Opitutaceae bacterium]HRJ46666.1 FkbM family methyltransferase [Opitutaceae bacterium]
MSNFSDLKSSHQAGRLDKAGYIRAMYARHEVLFDHAQHLAATNLAEIRITPGEVTATFKEPPVTMVCPAADTRIAPIEAFNFGDYEHADIQLVRRLVGLLDGAQVRFLDIGANAGFYSLALSHWFPGLAGAAFEPIPATYGHLRRNFALNGVGKIVPHNLGLSDQPGELVFYTYPSQSGSSSMTRNVDAADVQEVRCPVTTLDVFCAQHRLGADFIKCDVEGAELFVFKGGTGLLRRDRPAIFTEMLRKWCAKYQYHPNDIIAHLAGLGYGCHVVRHDRLTPCPTVTDDTKETNFIFLHRERHASVAAALA